MFFFISSSDHFKSKLENTFTNSILFFHSNKLVVDVVRLDLAQMMGHIVEHNFDHIVDHFGHRWSIDMYEIEKLHRLHM